MPSISVVIPCFNEEKYLGKLLQDLAGQTALPDEVIVADCQSEDKTLDIAKAFAKNLPLKIVISPKRTPGAARNAGADAAKGEYLLFIDADMRIPKNMISIIKDNLKSGADFITPAYKSDGQQIIDRLLIWIINVWMFSYIRILKRLVAIGGVIFVKKFVHQTIGGWNESLMSHDDIDYVNRLRKHSLKYLYLRDLRVIHSSRRFQNYGTLRAIAAILTENSQLARWIFQPLLTKIGKGRKYGNYK